MIDLGILANINNADQVIQNEVISLAFHCANCGKILPLDIPKNFYHECKRPDFVKDKLAL